MTGSAKVTAAVISSGSVNVDDRDPRGSTALMYCSRHGFTPVARVLLESGADVSSTDIEGFSALHASAQEGHVDVSNMLIKAGASVDAKVCDGTTPLHLASQKGHCGVMRVLIEAGANLDCRTEHGTTPLYIAAEDNQLMSIKLLLRAGARSDVVVDGMFVALDMATQQGYTDVVRELVEYVGIKGCGGDSCGAQALRLASEEEHIDIMRILIAAGVVDTGSIGLCGAAEYGRAGSMKLLLEQCKRRSADVRAYAGSCDQRGATPLILSIVGRRPGAARVARMLLEAGADTTVAAPVPNSPGLSFFNGKPMALAATLLCEKEIEGKPVTEQQHRTLKAVLRLLLTAEAVHAVSWLWAVDAHRRVAHRIAAEGATTGQAPSMQLALMLPTLRRRARNRGVLLASLFRYANKR
eukprot:g4928.t1